MKLFLLAAFLCAGVCFARVEEWSWLDQVSPNRKIEDTSFRTGREYHFFYNGQLTSGIPGASKQHSAHRMQSMVTVVFKGQNAVLMRLQNVRMGKLNREVSQPRKVMPFDAFEEVAIPQHLKTKLETTVKFSYSNGLVHDVIFDSHEDPWSANIKRGVLNMLQVNLQQHRRLDVDEPLLKNTMRDQETSDAIFYRVMEETLEGECETVYTIQKHPDTRYRSSSPVLNVTKSINFEKCKKRPQIKYNFRFADSCPTCESKYNDDEKFLKSSTVVKYNITGTKQAFLIESVRVESEYIFTPFNEETNVIITYVNQTLVLVKTGPIQSSLHEPQNPIESDSDMVFTLDWDIAYEKFHMTGDSTYHRRLHESEMGLNKVQLAKKLVQKLVEQMKEQLDEDVPRNFMRLVRVVRMCEESELEQIVRLQERGEMTNEDEKRIRNLIPQALGICGTKTCVKILTRKIRDGQITTIRGIMAIKALLQNRVVSKEIITELVHLAESDKARESEHLKRHIWLTIGSLINALCSENEDQLAVETKETPEKFCNRDLKETYVTLMFRKLRESSKWEEKILMLKSIANAGLDLSVFELEKIIRQQDQPYPMYMRFEAISALRQLKDVMQKKIQRLLTPLVMDRRELPSIRAAASYILLQTLPDRAILDQLARSLITEPSHQFASFLYTQMDSYANSTNPCEKKMATDMKLTLRNAKKISTGLGYSQLGRLTLHTPRHALGVDFDYDILFSNTSSMPRHLSSSIHLNVLGFWQKHVASLSLFNDGLMETLSREYLTESGLFGGLEHIFRRHPRNTGSEYERELDDIFSKHLRIRNRDYSSEYESKPKAYLSTMYKSQSINFLPFGKEAIQELISYGAGNLLELRQRLSQGLPIDYGTASLLEDVQYKIPTTIGLPLIVSMKVPIAWNLKGVMQAKLDSSKVFKVQAQLKPSVVATVVFDVMTWSPIVNTGVKVVSKAKLFTPIDAELKVDITSEPIIKLIIKPPTQKRDLVVLETRPVTYTRDWQRFVQTVETNEAVEEKTIMGEELNRVSTFNKCGSILGVQYCTRGQIHYTPIKSVKGTPFFPFSGPSKLVITCEPGVEARQDIEIELSSKLLRPITGEQIKPSFSKFQSLFKWNSKPTSESSESSEEFTNSNSQEQRRGSLESSEWRLSPKRRPSSSSSTPKNEFSSQRYLQEYRNYEVKKGYKNQLTLVVKSGSTRRLTVDLTNVFDFNKRYGKMDMRIQRLHPEQWQACFDAEMMFPETPAYTADVQDKKVLTSAKLNWGPTCSSENYIHLTSQVERSQQQMQWERELSAYKTYRSQNCDTNKAWCSPLAQEDFVERIGQMLKYRVELEYSHLPPTVHNITNKLYRALKYYYFWQTDVDQINVQNQPNKIRAEFILDAQTRQRVNITIKTPKENVRIQDLPLPKPVPFSFNQKKSFGKQFSELINENDEQAECSVVARAGVQRRAQIDTFDGVKYTVPFTNCWAVLAKDCGSSKPQFVVMARKSERAVDLRDVKIVTPNHRIELVPETEQYDSVKVKVNGRPYDPETEEDLTHHGHVVAEIDRDAKTVLVRLPEAGVEVDFDGYAINVRLSELYRAQQCGLCGHYDLETTDEFRNPDFTSEHDLRQFYLNYLIKDGSCQVPRQLEEICQDDRCDHQRSSESSSSSSSSSEEDDKDNDDTTEKPQLRTKVIELDEKICFSTVQVPQCDDDSYPIHVQQQKKIAYVCFDQDSQSAEHIERQARYGKHEIPALRNRQPTFTRTENIPEKCKEYTRN